MSLLLVVLDDEVFVGEHSAVDGLAALPVAVREVPALHHEVLHHAVEHRPVVVKRLPYTIIKNKSRGSEAASLDNS